MNNIPEFDKTKKYKLLMFSHMGVDNLGDQVIEICSNALVRTALKNTGIDDYQIISVDASIVNERSLSVHSEEQPETAEKLIKDADLVIFGGSPVFNYTYERFSERTIKTLTIIHKYGKPVIFSAIGVERFSPDNIKCMRLKEALSFPEIKMITTRDNIEALRKLTEGTLIKTAKVSDPAVFSALTMKKYIDRNSEIKPPKIGIFIIRENAFIDNGIDFPKEKAIELWQDIVSEITKRGYDCELLTSGYHGDEAFLNKLTMEYGFSGDHCVNFLNTPEELIEKLSGYSGVISCRLHPSIISYSMEIPSVGLVWNDKVGQFYESIGYPERSIVSDTFTAETIVDKLEGAMQKGVFHSKDFLISVYKHLFDGIKDALDIHNDTKAYSYEEVADCLPLYTGSDYKEKTESKISRIYRTLSRLNDIKEKTELITAEKKELVCKYNQLYISSKSGGDIPCFIKEQTFTMFYSIMKKDSALSPIDPQTKYSGKISDLKDQFRLKVDEDFKNNGLSKFAVNIFSARDNYKFAGYRLRASACGNIYFLLRNGEWIEKASYDRKKHKFAIFNAGDNIPIVDLDNISSLLAITTWTKLT